ncbi:hypothetical protein AB1K70_03655 [Bremerella sp. JC770]|uniref:hypothetical protein n=1 Tax=Bremerella sp. JC770 TaxID=3232137 RepID=UPI00345A1588
MIEEKAIIEELQKADVNFKIAETGPARVYRVYNVCNAQDQDRVVELASKLTGLKVLNANHCNSLTDEGAKAIGRMSGLEVLDVSLSSLKGTSFRHFKGLCQLQVLRAADVSSLSSGVPYLAGLKSLQELSFSGSDFDDAALMHLQGNVELDSLGASCTKLTGSGFQTFLPTNKLKRISAFGCPITRDGLDSIVSLSRLKDLCFSINKTDCDLDLLGVNWPALETLDLSEVSVTSEILKELAQIETLMWLRINETDLVNVDLSPINNLRSLEDLLLDSTDVSATQINKLVELKKLNVIGLAGNNINPQDLAPLRAALPNCEIWCE